MHPDAARVAETREWLIKAALDLRAAEFEFTAGPPLSADIIFHCQRCAEKSMKGFLIWHDEPFRKTLHLVPLVRQREDVDAHVSQWRDTARSLNPNALDSRYPGPPLEPSPEQGVETVPWARQAVQFVLARLPEGVRS